MSQHYSDPKRESDPHALPDLEVWHAPYVVCADCGRYDISGDWERPCKCASVLRRTLPDGAGWFYWSCFPGCLPDSEPMGPFETEAEALADAREDVTRDGDIDEEEEG